MRGFVPPDDACVIRFAWPYVNVSLPLGVTLLATAVDSRNKGVN